MPFGKSNLDFILESFCLPAAAALETVVLILPGNSFILLSLGVLGLSNFSPLSIGVLDCFVCS